jgi:CheY-like chemotaxis protein
MSALQSLRIFVVEDDVDSANSLALLLRWMGHESHVAVDGAVALEIASVLQPDLMLIDLAMPNLDGCELALRLRERGEFANTPLVAVSGYVDGKHRQQAAESGFDDFLGKPYTADDLLQLFARLQPKFASGNRLPK